MKYFVMLVTVSFVLLACKGNDPSTSKPVLESGDDTTAVVNTVTESGVKVPHTVGLNTYSITNQTDVEILIFSKGRTVVLKQNECVVLGESDFTQNESDFKIMKVGGSSRNAHCNTISIKCKPANRVIVASPWYVLSSFDVKTADFNNSPDCKTLPPL